MNQRLFSDIERAGEFIAELSKESLAKHLDKGSWEGCEVPSIFMKLMEEVGEAAQAWNKNAPTEHTLAELGDVAATTAILMDLLRRRLQHGR